jgi:hypothetical protein
VLVDFAIVPKTNFFRGPNSFPVTARMEKLGFQPAEASAKDL